MRDDTFGDRVGWKAIVAAPGQGTAVRSSVAASDPTNGLRTYPAEVLDSPADVREARLDVEPGAGTLTAPDGERTFAGQDTNRAEREFTDVFSDAAAGEGVLLLLLLAAFGWGAVHALSPGHGKAMVAAYLVGTRGKPRHAVALGLIVTVTHTIGVFALGAITLGALAVRAARDALPVAEPRVRPARRARRRRRCCAGICGAYGHKRTAATTPRTITRCITTGTITPPSRPLPPRHDHHHHAPGLALGAREGAARRRPSPRPRRRRTGTATSRRSRACAAWWRWARPRA